MILFNCGLVGGLNEGKIGTLIGVACACCIAGGLVAWFVAKLVEKYFVKIALACAGGALAGVLTAPLAIPGIAKTAAIVVGAAIGYFTAREAGRYIECGAPAVVGSVLLFHGISGFVGGFPAIGTHSIKSLDPIFFGYVGGIIVFACLGTFVQLKYLNGMRVSDNFTKEEGDNAAGDDQRFA
jgi:hypothetical protein